MGCYLGIDAGTSGIKVLVIDEQGNVLGSGYEECDIITPMPGWVEQDPETWWNALDIAMEKAMQACGCGQEVKGIGFSGQMQGLVLLDKEGKVLNNCIIWMDQRSTEEVRYVESVLQPKETLAVTANYCLNSYWLPKLLWTKKNRPDVYERIAMVLFPKDYLRFRLTGEYATEVSDNAQSYLFDVPNRKWCEPLFEAFGISKEIVPEKMLESSDIAGYLKPDLARKWGLRPDIPVAAGGGDQTVCGVGTGIVRPGIFGSSIGTSGVVFGCTKEPLIDPQRRALMSMCHSVKGMWGFLGLGLTSGASMKWLRDTIFAEKKVLCAEQGLDIYDYITGLASQAPVGSEGLCFLPYLNGDKTPNNDENARGVLFGLSYRHGLNEVCRSFMEGVTFSLRETVEICREFGMEVHEIHASGGGSKSKLWRQMQADIYNADVITMNIDEGPAVGAAILAATAVGTFRDVPEGCDAILKVADRIVPDKENVKIYEDYFRTYQSLYGALKASYAQQAQVVKKYV